MQEMPSPSVTESLSLRGKYPPKITMQVFLRKLSERMRIPWIDQVTAALPISRKIVFCMHLNRTRRFQSGAPWPDSSRGGLRG